MKGSAAKVGAGSNSQALLLKRLADPTAYPHPVAGDIRQIETHISNVFLTGQFAYKIKKPVNLGFLDFSCLDQRRFFCEEELRLNRRLAPRLYLEVLPIGDASEEHCVGSSEPAIEYAVKMIEFPQSSRFDLLLSRGVLSAAQIDALADRVASFHQQTVRADATDARDLAGTVWESFAQTLAQLRESLSRIGQLAAKLELLDEIEVWGRAEHDRLKDALIKRKRAGFVRECHGDLHLANVAWWFDEAQVFDCIEFCETFRWIDVISEVAFMTMDLSVRDRADYAFRFLNRYLENTGDYGGLEFLPFYEVYRALVRAMVAAIRTVQSGEATCAENEVACGQYLEFACRRGLACRKLVLILMHGYSGSGKTTVAQRLLEDFGAIRIRSDVERKRLSGLAAGEHGGGDTIESGIYAAKTTQVTYQRLVQLADLVLRADFSVIVDSASLKFWQRELFRALARTLDIPFLLLACHAEVAVLYERLSARAATGMDASDAGPAVLSFQLANSDSLTSEEQRTCAFVGSEHDELGEVIARLRTESGDEPA